MNRNLFFIFFLFSSMTHFSHGQDTRKYTFDEIILIARQQSPPAVLARHRFRQSYWEYRTYRASFLPTLSMDATLPDLNRSIERVTQDDGSDAFRERSLVNSSVSFELGQNIGLTGGRVFMSSDLDRIRFLADSIPTSYSTSPISIGLRQPINGYNEFRWERQIEPLKYERAQLEYIQSLERVTLRSVSFFFDLLLAQKNIEISMLNYSNADTLYQIARGRYQLGTIAENELLQMELAYLNAGTALNEANIDLEIKKFQLNSYLGLPQDVDIELIIPKEIPGFEIELQRALDEAWKNNPDILERRQQMLQAEQEVSRTKSEKGLNATLFASFGLTQQALNLRDAYTDLDNEQRAVLGIEIPIVDWGLGKGRYRMAQSAMEVTRTNVQQAEMDFQQEVLLEVMQFNLQDDQLVIAAKADTIALKRFEVTKQRFLIGRISVLDLNVAQTEKDEAARAYLSALRNYWNYFYNLRSLTLYDWMNEQPLQQNFDDILN
ncbi:MAG: TolC family protein [Bacteroidales bacterium]|nr:TolC family protein [Bacteroidales bacterium]